MVFGSAGMPAGELEPLSPMLAPSEAELLPVPGGEVGTRAAGFEPDAGSDGFCAAGPG